MSKRKNRLNNNGGMRIVSSDIPASCPPALPTAAPAPQEITTFASAAEVGQVVEITDEEKSKIRALQVRKETLCAQAGALEAQKLHVLLAARDADAQLMALAVEIAKAHGIDNTDTSKAWDFNSSRLAFTRTK